MCIFRRGRANTIRPCGGFGGSWGARLGRAPLPDRGPLCPGRLFLLFSSRQVAPRRHLGNFLFFTPPPNAAAGTSLVPASRPRRLTDRWTQPMTCHNLSNSAKGLAHFRVLPKQRSVCFPLTFFQVLNVFWSRPQNEMTKEQLMYLPCIASIQLFQI